MAGPHEFEARSTADLIRLIRQSPLVWIFARDDSGYFATAAPVCLHMSGDEPASLVGHVPRTSRLAGLITSSTEALVVSAGPNAYISPSWFSDRTQAPTWNFVSAQFCVQIESSDDPRFLADHLDELVGILERDRERFWSVAEMGGRREKLARRIIAFDAKIGSWDGRFKLGQDEPAQTFAEITTALRAAGEHSVLSWMEDFNDHQ